MATMLPRQPIITDNKKVIPNVNFKSEFGSGRLPKLMTHIAVEVS
jgi:hypothetical protein